MAIPSAGDGRRRRGWVWIVAAGVAVNLIVCVALALLAPVALSRFHGKLGGLAGALVCPTAKASDAAPRDYTGQFTVQPVYTEALKYASDAGG
ncbi:MAG TPA: hypothetical protein VF725_10380, partial [Ktedonobacterales bacterium]